MSRAVLWQFTIFVMENGSNGLRLTGVTDVTLSYEKVTLPFNFLHGNLNIREKAGVILYGTVYKK